MIDYINISINYTVETGNIPVTFSHTQIGRDVRRTQKSGHLLTLCIRLHRRQMTHGICHKAVVIKKKAEKNKH